MRKTVFRQEISGRRLMAALIACLLGLVTAAGAVSAAEENDVEAKATLLWTGLDEPLHLPDLPFVWDADDLPQSDHRPGAWEAPFAQQDPEFGMRFFVNGPVSSIWPSAEDLITPRGPKVSRNVRPSGISASPG